MKRSFLLVLSALALLLVGFGAGEAHAHGALLKTGAHPGAHASTAPHAVHATIAAELHEHHPGAAGGGTADCDGACAACCAAACAGTAMVDATLAVVAHSDTAALGPVLTSQGHGRTIVPPSPPPRA